MPQNCPSYNVLPPAPTQCIIILLNLLTDKTHLLKKMVKSCLLWLFQHPNWFLSSFKFLTCLTSLHLSSTWSVLTSDWSSTDHTWTLPSQDDDAWQNNDVTHAITLTSDWSSTDHAWTIQSHQMPDKSATLNTQSQWLSTGHQLPTPKHFLRRKMMPNAAVMFNITLTKKNTVTMKICS